ncbi:MAG: polysaccharide biosynthesis protein [Erysipelotrichia bacterium]|nr:polysaccharide biosynthesis protein [Erysipelotrichia bacterium]
MQSWPASGSGRGAVLSIKKNVIANYLGSGWAALMGLAFIPVYIKYLGMEAYGLIGMYAMLQASLAIVDAGMTPTLTREISRFTGGENSAQSIRDLLRTMELAGLSIALVYVGVIWHAAEWLTTSWLKVESLPITVVSESVIIMGIVIATRIIEGLYRGAIIGLQKQVLFNAINVGIATLRNFGAAMVLAWWSPTITAYFLWQGFVSVIAVMSLSYFVYRHIPATTRPGKFSSTELKRVWRFAAGIFTTTCLAFLLTQIDKMLLSRILTLKEFGNYNLAATIANSLMLLVIPISQAHYPRITELQSQNQPESVKKVFHQGAQLITVIVGSASCVLFFFGEIIIGLWTGNEELGRQTAALTKILTIGTMLNSFMNMPYLLQLSNGITHYAAAVNFVSAIILIPAILIITPKYGAIGAAFIWPILNSFYVFIFSPFIFKTIYPTERYKWYAEDLFKPFVVAFLITLSFWLFKPVFTGKFYNGLFILTSGFAALIGSVFAADILRMKIRTIIQPANKTGDTF